MIGFASRSRLIFSAYASAGFVDMVGDGEALLRWIELSEVMISVVW